MIKKTRCGYVAIIGRPNVGKSTLLNRLVGQKVSITSKKPQTTQHQIVGIQTVDKAQAIYIDTPGLHIKTPKALNRLMNRAAITAIRDVDLIVFMIDARHWMEEDQWILEKFKNVSCPVILVLNKVDLIKDKKRLLPRLEELSQKMSFAEIIPLSLSKEVNVDRLEQIILDALPENEHLFPSDLRSNQDDRFLVSEMIREKIMRLTNQEIPYDTVVHIDSMQREGELLSINVTIWVERLGQKIILIGKNGEKLKEIGSHARHDLETTFHCKVYLNLWIKVKEGWSDDTKQLTNLGF